MARTNTLVGISQLRNEANNILEALNPPIKPKEVGTLFNHIIDYLPLEGNSSSGSEGSIVDNYIAKIVPNLNSGKNIATVYPKTGNSFTLYAPESNGGGDTNLLAVWKSLKNDNNLLAYSDSTKIDSKHLDLSDYPKKNDFNSSSNTPLKNYTWWGRSLLVLGSDTNTHLGVEGNLKGGIDYIEFSNGVRLGVESSSADNRTLKVFYGGNLADPAHFYATGGVSALGLNDSSGSGGTPSDFCALLADLNTDTNIGNSAPDNLDPLPNNKALMWGDEGGSTYHWYWGDVGNTYTLPAASSSDLGGIKIDYDAPDGYPKNIPLLLDSDSKAFVNLGDFATTAEVSAEIGASLSDYLTSLQIKNTYLSRDFFHLLFAIEGTRGGNSVQNITQDDDFSGDPPTATITAIKALHGLWTELYLSALGINSDLPNNFIVAGNWAEFFNGITYNLPPTALGYLRFDGDSLSWSAGPADGDTQASITIKTTNSLTVNSGSEATESTPAIFEIGVNENYQIPSSTLVNTLESHLYEGNKLLADKADKLVIPTIPGTSSEGTRILFGNNYFTNGIPQNIGYAGSTDSLNYVQNISMCGNIDIYKGGINSNTHLRIASGLSDSPSMRMYWIKDGNSTTPTTTLTLFDFYNTGMVKASKGLWVNSINNTLNANTSPVTGTDTCECLRIGDGLISWDYRTNSLKISKYKAPTGGASAQEEAANLYATGGVSALGIPNSPSGSVESASIDTINTSVINIETDSTDPEDTEKGIISYDGSNDANSKLLFIRGLSKVTLQAQNNYVDGQGVHAPHFYLTEGIYLHYDPQNHRLLLNRGGNDYEVNVGSTPVSS